MMLPRTRALVLLWIVLFAAPALFLLRCFSGTPSTPTVSCAPGSGLDWQGLPNATGTVCACAAPDCMAGETIFVTIASYRDVYCSACLDSIFEQAAHPENIRIGLVVQYDMSSAQVS
jgi:hypothetical protein